MPVHILLTKGDKLKRGPAKTVLFNVKKHIEEAGFGNCVSIQVFSALKGDGLAELENKLRQWLTQEESEATPEQ